MNQLIRHIFFGIAVLFLVSCEEPSDFPTTTDHEQKLVVQALITNEFRIQEIQLSLSINDLNQLPDPVTNATLEIMTQNNSFQFTHDRNGLYKSDVPFSTSQGLEHVLMINWNGDEYLATSSDTTYVAPMPPIEFMPVQNDSSLFRIMETIPIYSGFEQSMYQFDLDWRMITGDSSAIARIYEYTFSNIHINQVIPPPKDVIRFPSGTQVIVSKYGLNDDYAEFLMSTLLSTEYNGNVFYSSLSSPPSNVSNGGLGYFSVARTLRDTLIVP